MTGASGYIASQLLPVFRERYELRAIDVRATNARGDSIKEVDVVNLLEDSENDLDRVFDGVDAVVHLGYYRPPDLGVTGADG